MRVRNVGTCKIYKSLSARKKNQMKSSVPWLNAMRYQSCLISCHSANLLQRLLCTDQSRSANHFIFLVLSQIEHLIFAMVWVDSEKQRGWKSKFFQKAYQTRYPDKFAEMCDDEIKEKMSSIIKTREYRQFRKQYETVVTRRNQFLDLYLNVSIYSHSPLIFCTLFNMFLSVWKYRIARS